MGLWTLLNAGHVVQEEDQHQSLGDRTAPGIIKEGPGSRRNTPT